MWNGTIKQLNVIMRIEYATCEIPLFSPGFRTFPEAPCTEVFYCWAVRSREKIGKGGNGDSGELGLKKCFREPRNWGTGLRWNWEMGNGNGNWEMEMGNSSYHILPAVFFSPYSSRKMNRILRIEYMTCEIPLFSPAIRTFPRAPLTYDFYCWAVRSRVANPRPES